MATSRKRTLNEMQSNDLSLQPLLKKQRINDSNESIKNVKQRFIDNKDNKQYLNIYNALIESELPLTSNISSVCCQIIAFFATGKISKCYHCQEIVSYLNDDIFNKDLFKITTERGNQFICKQCKLTQFNCNFCKIIYQFTENRLCSICHRCYCPNIHCKDNNDCQCNQYSLDRICNDCSMECDYCHCKICMECNIYCEQCDLSRCNECIEDCIKCQSKICIGCKNKYKCSVCNINECEQCLVECQSCSELCCTECVEIDGHCLKCAEQESDQMNHESHDESDEISEYDQDNGNDDDDNDDYDFY